MPSRRDEQWHRYSQDAALGRLLTAAARVPAVRALCPFTSLQRLFFADRPFRPGWTSWGAFSVPEGGYGVVSGIVIHPPGVQVATADDAMEVIAANLPAGIESAGETLPHDWRSGSEETDRILRAEAKTALIGTLRTHRGPDGIVAALADFYDVARAIGNPRSREVAEAFVRDVATAHSIDPEIAWTLAQFNPLGYQWRIGAKAEMAAEFISRVANREEKPLEEARRLIAGAAHAVIATARRTPLAISGLGTFWVGPPRRGATAASSPAVSFRPEATPDEIVACEPLIADNVRMMFAAMTEAFATGVSFLHVPTLGAFAGRPGEGTDAFLPDQTTFVPRRLSFSPERDK